VRAEQLGSAGWRKVAEVAVARPGGEPTGEEYAVVDESAPAGGSCEYRVEELTAGGEVGLSVEAKP